LRERSKGMPIFRGPTGEYRLAWRLIFVILLFVGIEVLLRAIPIAILVTFMLKSDITRSSAIESARELIFEGPIWSTAIGILSGFMGFLIVWFLVRVAEKSEVTWKTFGLDWRSSTLSMVLIGILLAAILYIAYMAIEYLLETSDYSVSTAFTGVNFSTAISKLILFIAMGFGEEVVFRAYVQTRLLGRFGVCWGVLGTALIFTLLHQISYHLSPITVLSGVILWTALGLLYYQSKSLYLVGTFHGIMNTLLNTLNFEVSDIAPLIVHALTLMTLILFVRYKSKSIGNSSNPA
jgi:membrane protease YdiL (CAAX protease family)